MSLELGSMTQVPALRRLRQENFAWVTDQPGQHRHPSPFQNTKQKQRNRARDVARVIDYLLSKYEALVQSSVLKEKRKTTDKTELIQFSFRDPHCVSQVWGGQLRVGVEGEGWGQFHVSAESLERQLSCTVSQTDWSWGGMEWHDTQDKLSSIRALALSTQNQVCRYTCEICFSIVAANTSVRHIVLQRFRVFLEVEHIKSVCVCVCVCVCVFKAYWPQSEKSLLLGLFSDVYCH
jgi:hypothetical protein